MTASHVSGTRARAVAGVERRAELAVPLAARLADGRADRLAPSGPGGPGPDPLGTPLGDCQAAGQRSFISHRSYLATRLGLEALTAQLYREALPCGLGPAKQARTADLFW